MISSEPLEPTLSPPRFYLHIYEPVDEILVLITYARSEGSEEPAQTPDNSSESLRFCNKHQNRLS